jgi:starvation-inducible DNA-binding protein
MATKKKKKLAAAPADDAPRWHAKARVTQQYGTVVEDMPHFLDASVRQDMVVKLNQLLADAITLRDMYKKHHWQISGPTFYELHILFDKHFEEQVELVDTIAERIQILGGVSVAMGGDVSKLTKIPAPPIGREDIPVQISRLLQAHKHIMQECHDIAEAADDAGDDGTNDMVVSDILRANELQSWFIGQHLVNQPMIE